MLLCTHDKLFCWILSNEWTFLVTRGMKNQNFTNQLNKNLTISKKKGSQSLPHSSLKFKANKLMKYDSSHYNYENDKMLLWLIWRRQSIAASERASIFPTV